MRIAVSSHDYRKVTGHAGQAQRWLLFETDGVVAPVLTDRLELRLCSSSTGSAVRGRIPSTVSPC